MRKLLIIVVVLSLFIMVLSGCGKNNEVDDTGTPTPYPAATINPEDNQTATDISSLTDAEIFKFDPSTNTLNGFQETIIGITDIVIPSEIDGYIVKNIGANAFYEKGLNSLILPDSLEKIEEYAFAKNNLTQVSFPDSLSVIENGAFLQNAITELTVPEKITEINMLSFSENQIAKINLPGKLTIVRQSAFRNNKLTEINFPSSLLIIESFAFQENLLSNLVFNDGLERIDGYAFDSNKLKSITIPASVKSIGYPTPDATPVKYYERFTFAYNLLESITILGSDIDLNSFILTDNNNFKNAYLSQGAGTYSGTQIGTWKKVN